MNNYETDSEQQYFIQHLIELRRKLLRCIVAVLVIFIALFYFANDIYFFISEPLRAHLPKGSTMIATEVASTFLAPFKLTLFIAFCLAIPYILHQIWQFIAPGLYYKEKKVVIPTLIISVLLFYLGIFFAYFVIFPLIFSFFNTIGPESVVIMTDINRYLEFILKLFFAFGIAFEIPVITVLLVWTGISTSDNLSAKRPYIVVGCFIIGMLLTPPDAISQSLLAIPMWLLFEAGILFSRMI